MVDLREPLESLISFPARFTAGTTFPRAREIRLYDTTLRDGEQTPGVAFTPEQKYELAGMLSDAGVHIIDMGFPSAAPSERRALELILEGKARGRIRAPGKVSPTRFKYGAPGSARSIPPAGGGSTPRAVSGRAQSCGR